MKVCGRGRVSVMQLFSLYFATYNSCVTLSLSGPHVFAWHKIQLKSMRESMHRQGKTCSIIIITKLRDCIIVQLKISRTNFAKERHCTVGIEIYPQCPILTSCGVFFHSGWLWLSRIVRPIHLAKC